MEYCSHFPCGSVDWNLESGRSSYCLQSLPLRKCGLKFLQAVSNRCWFTVTSLAEVWIEILLISCKKCSHDVTSLAEVWIEISRSVFVPLGAIVTSLAEVWIEMGYDAVGSTDGFVTSLAEVWIEISEGCRSIYGRCHFPCGSVDWNPPIQEYSVDK